jgi:N-acetylmuramoyl-L-alanine amidase
MIWKRTKFGLGLGLACVMLLISAASGMRLVASDKNPNPLESALSFADTLFENTPYFRMTDADSLIGAKGDWIPDRQKWVSQDKQGRSWVFTLDNAFCAVGDRVYNLTYPVRRSADGLWLPLHPFLRLLQSQGGPALRLVEGTSGQSASTSSDKALSESASRQASSGAEASQGDDRHSQVTVLGPVECEQRSNGTLVRVAAVGPLDPEILWVAAHYLARFNQARLAEGVAARNDGKGLVDKVFFIAEHGQVQMTLQTLGNVDTIEMEAQPDSHALQFLVRKTDAKRVKAEAAKANAKKATQEEKGTIIIDPGHGGNDQGAMVNGVKEAHVTLSVAKQLKSALVKLGYKALLTRDGDTYVSLADRPKFASDNGGDLFVSLHCNSLEGSRKHKRQISGFTVYILREGESEEDNALARRENEAIQEEKGKANKKEISPVDWILLEHQLNLYSKQSETLAEKIIHGFEGFEISKYSTGARQAGFFVLVGAYMPAVLFEMGFLTNDHDRAFLASSKGQKRIAKQMSEAIDRFMVQRESE